MRVEGGVEMTEVGDNFFSPEPPVPTFGEGDMVHVFEGTGAGKKGGRDVAWFGRVVGREGEAYLVRNRLLAAKGRPTLVEGKFMKLQVDFGLESGSGERVHFRNLGKRTRERILQSADERNNWTAKEAKNELTKIKQQRTKEKDAYLLRRARMDEIGTSSRQQTQKDYDEQINYWQSQTERLKDKMKTSLSNYKRISEKKEVFICFVLCLDLFLPLLPYVLICFVCPISTIITSETILLLTGRYNFSARKS